MKKDVWQKTSNEMELQSFQFSWQQCEQKWKNLTKTYRDTIDHNRMSGNDRKECAYFKELQDCYGYRPNVQVLVRFFHFCSHCCQENWKLCSSISLLVFCQTSFFITEGFSNRLSYFLCSSIR
jgi:hypothetical protein